jgi:hypothetical protein
MLQLFQMNAMYIRMLQWLYTYIDLFPMFHLYFWMYCCKSVYLDVAYVSHISCKYFIWILRMFVMVFKCFIYL